MHARGSFVLSWLSVHHSMKSESRNVMLPSMAESTPPGWSFLTNHAQVLVCIAHDPGIRLRDIGDRVGITERAAHRIVTELADAGYITRQRNGRRNHYTINPTPHFPTRSHATRTSANYSRSSLRRRGTRNASGVRHDGRIAEPQAGPDRGYNPTAFRGGSSPARCRASRDQSTARTRRVEDKLAAWNLNGPRFDSRGDE